MAVHATSLLKNVKGSIRKFLSENLITVEKLEVTFDSSFEFQNPEAAGKDISSAKKWIDFTLLNNDLGQTQAQDVKLTCAARGSDADSELVDLRDTLMNYLTDPGSTNGFKTRRIVFYDVSDEANLVKIGNMMFLNIKQSPVFRLRDNTKFMIITVTVTYDSRI